MFANKKINLQTETYFDSPKFFVCKFRNGRLNSSQNKCVFFSNSWILQRAEAPVQHNEQNSKRQH